MIIRDATPPCWIGGDEQFVARELPEDGAAAPSHTSRRDQVIDCGGRLAATRHDKRSRLTQTLHGSLAALLSNLNPSFYNHVQTREDQLAALWSHIGSRPFRAIQVACDGLDDPAESLSAEARLVIRRAGSDPV